MSDSLRERRIANEGKILDSLVAANPGALAADGWRREAGADVLSVTLFQTPAYVEPDTIALVHRLRVEFPEYFPAVPIALYMERPVLHPNIDPASGFVCLWAAHAPGDTLVETLLQAQRVLTWRLSNREPSHAMQPDAPDCAPLPYTPLAVPPDLCSALPQTPSAASSRRRLSPIR